jgi:hypothetical protein
LTRGTRHSYCDRAYILGRARQPKLCPACLPGLHTLVTIVKRVSLLQMWTIEAIFTLGCQCKKIATSTARSPPIKGLRSSRQLSYSQLLVDSFKLIFTGVPFFLTFRTDIMILSAAFLFICILSGTNAEIVADTNGAVAGRRNRAVVSAVHRNLRICVFCTLTLHFHQGPSASLEIVNKRISPDGNYRSCVTLSFFLAEAIQRFLQCCSCRWHISRALDQRE